MNDIRKIKDSRRIRTPTAGQLKNSKSFNLGGQNMQMPITAEDVLVSIFYFMKKNKKSKLTADRESLHRAFYDVSKKYPNVMSLFSFRQREIFPESAQLDQALSNLDATGLISRQNLIPRYYHFEKPLMNSYRNFSKKILNAVGIEETEIKTVADEIENLTMTTS